jgi:predicted Na+-dependent transporter
VGYRELWLVVVAAAVGLSVQGPLRSVDRHQGLNALLVVLVFATAVTISPEALRRVGASWPVLVLALAATLVTLPALAWAASRIVGAGTLRDGVLAVGLAPCEIASVATTAMAGGAPALSAGLLLGSTVVSVAAAGPILALEAGHASVHSGRVVQNLVLVVAVPFVVGALVRWRWELTARAEAAAGTIAAVAVAALVAVIAAEVHLSGRYGAVLAALVVFLAGSAGLGWLLARALGRDGPDGGGTGLSLLLTTSMRDFAIAAGMASSAFGAAAAAPLGLYGILVLAWGTGVAGLVRRRRLRQPGS